MLQRNSRLLSLSLIAAFLFLAQLALSQAGSPPQPNPPESAPQQNPPASAPSTTQGQPPVQKSGDIYVFHKEVDEVTLHATVVDDKNHLVSNLDRADFTVYEDGQPQKITSFRHVFIVNFNEDFFLDQDYTASIPKLKDALERIEARGGTALYDAVVASSDHLKKSGLLEKKVLLVVTDGEDNASRESLEQAIRRLQEENGPTVYSIGLLAEEHSKRAKRALREMAEQTGGIAFFPQGLAEVDSITQQIAHDIRNQYTIGYKPSKPQSEGGFRSVKVDANAKGYKKLQVRTRSGYYAGQQRAETQQPTPNSEVIAATARIRGGARKPLNRVILRRKPVVVARLELKDPVVAQNPFVCTFIR